MPVPQEAGDRCGPVKCSPKNTVRLIVSPLCPRTIGASNSPGLPRSSHCLWKNDLSVLLFLCRLIQNDHLSDDLYNLGNECSSARICARSFPSSAQFFSTWILINSLAFNASSTDLVISGRGWTCRSVKRHPWSLQVPLNRNAVCWS